MANHRLSRNFFPEPKFQMRFLSILIGGMLLQTMVTTALISYFIRENYLLLVQYGALETPVKDALYKELYWLITGISGIFAVFLIGNTVLGILFSHRIAGPIFALKRTIRAILNDESAELSFRNQDEFRELTDSFNEMVRKLERGEIRSQKTV
jgi:methyl-accepting chemotaxis protein